jgi:hypothetical protein
MMEIQAKNFTITMTADELFPITVALKRMIEDGIQHAARHNGSATLESNHQLEITFYKEIMRVLGCEKEGIYKIDGLYKEADRAADEYRKEKAQ